MAGYIGSRASVVSSGAERKKTFDITGTTTSLTGLSYTVNQVHVFHNGVRLVDGTDFTATNGNSITLTSAAESGDEVVVVSYATFQTSDTVSASAGGTFSNAITSTAAGTALTLDRTGSDGTILDLNKDGSTVGSIGTGLSSLAVGTGNTQLMFWNAQSGIFPSNGTTVTDNSIDFGNPNYRFKDLYLSGGVFLGGVGSANKLDDYEEGTWTPSFNTGSFANIQNFTYTKIGRLVHLTGYLGTPSGLPSGGNLVISGLPFPASGNFNMAPMWYNGSSSVIAMGYIGNGDYTLNVRPVGGYPSTFTELSVQMVYTTTA